MPRLGQPLPPPPSDLAEVLATSAPLDSTVPFDPAMESEFTGRAGGTGVRPTTVSHTQSSKIPLYNYLGEDRLVAIADLEQVIDPKLPADQRLHIRCPKCVTLPNGGLHEFSGPNACPGKERSKFMVCPICASRGVTKRVYESDDGAVIAIAATEESDPDYEAYALPSPATRREVLQEKLELHMTSFHASAQAQYGIRREPSGNGWRIVRSRD